MIDNRLFKFDDLPISRQNGCEPWKKFMICLFNNHKVPVVNYLGRFVYWIKRTEPN